MRIFIAATILFFTLITSTHARVSTVHCPDIETVHQSANTIIDAALVNGSYIAATAPFAIRTPEMGWFAVVNSIKANSINDAIDNARLSMLNVSSLVNEFADDLAGIYVCKYDQGKIEVINNDEEWRQR